MRAGGRVAWKRLGFAGTGTASQCCAAALCLALAAAPANAATLTSVPFGTMRDGRPVTQYNMSTPGGVSVSFISYGGAITSIVTPERWGAPANLVLGFPTLRDCETKEAEGGLYFGALIGRYANWIAGGRFTLGGHAIQVTRNLPPNSIHGGSKGFDKQIWGIKPAATSGPAVSALPNYTSPDGEEGFPDTMRVGVTYTLSDDGAFTIRYEATADRDTVVNLTSHSNFNIAGAGLPGGVLRQVLMVDADRYTPTDTAQIPLGQLAPVQGTPFDFRTPTAIGARIRARDAQLAIALGYDQNWVLNKRGDPAQPQPAARAYDPGGGRTLECLATEPSVQIYTGGFLDGTYAGDGGRYGPDAAFTLETQHFPDSPNHPGFPTTELKARQTFRSTTVFRFGVQR